MSKLLRMMPRVAAKLTGSGVPKHHLTPTFALLSTHPLSSNLEGRFRAIDKASRVFLSHSRSGKWNGTCWGKKEWLAELQRDTIEQPNHAVPIRRGVLFAVACNGGFDSRLPAAASLSGNHSS